MDQERLALVALHFIPGIGPRLIRQLVSYCGGAAAVFSKPKGKLLKVPSVGHTTAEALRSKKAFATAEKELKKCDREDAEILLYTDKQFPNRLKALDDAPTLLYWKGTGNLNVAKTVAIVGTRQATGYGKSAVERIITDLLPHKSMIISGLAYGIDIHAHKTALRLGLPTIGVMGSGIDVIYPSAHSETAYRMMDGGGLITEKPFGTKPEAHHFPSRNRIIAGMADVIVVAEAAEKGGALITAEIANSYNRDVFAIPGSLGQDYSSGCNKLIKTNKANLLTSVKDIEYIMNWSADETNSKAIAVDRTQFSETEWLIVDALTQKKVNMSIDELAWRTGLTPGHLAELLLMMELKGVIKVYPGKMFGMI